MRSARGMREEGLPTAFWAALERARAASHIIRHLTAARFCADRHTRATLDEIIAFHRGRRRRFLAEVRVVVQLLRRPLEEGVAAPSFRKEAESIRRHVLFSAYAGLLRRRKMGVV